MDRKFALAVVLSFLVLFIFQVWFAPKASRKVTPVVSDTTHVEPGSTELRSIPGSVPAPHEATAESSSANFPRNVPEEIIPVHASQFDVSFTTLGGRLASCSLKDYKAKDGTPVGLLKSPGELDLLLERGKEFIDLGDVS